MWDGKEHLAYLFGFSENGLSFLNPINVHTYSKVKLYCDRNLLLGHHCPIKRIARNIYMHCHIDMITHIFDTAVGSSGWASSIHASKYSIFLKTFG